MARNKVQYQKGLSEAEFDHQYGSEKQCRAAVAKWRWPDGFVCPRCGGRQHSMIKTRALYQCTACRRRSLPAPSSRRPSLRCGAGFAPSII